MAEQRYRVVERLEAGGMAEVFVGEQTGAQGFKKKVAIKRVLPHLAQNKKFITMFLDEARLGARLTHANIVTVIDIGAADNTYFIVMEFVDGANLKQIMEIVRKRGGHFPMKDAIYICIECLRGLSYAHEITGDDGEPLGIVHRDISPPNIMITKRGEVKVTDFGLAKASTQLEKTDPGVVKGKFSYLSPEAAMGQEVDLRTDIFALGIMLWEMLAGRRLFLGETDFQTVKLVQQANVPSLAKLNPEVDAEFEKVLGKALTRDPRDRYQTAHEMGDALAGYLFAHGMKVTGFDIATLVQGVVAEKQKKPGGEQKGQASIIDRLIQEELLRFTSLDDLSEQDKPGEKALSPEDVGDGSKPLDLGGFESPDKWFADDEEVKDAIGGAARASQPGWREGAKPDDEDLASMLEAEEAIPARSDPTKPTRPEGGARAPQPQPPTPALSGGGTSAAALDDGKKSGSGAILYVVIALLVVAAGGAAAWFGGLIPH